MASYVPQPHANSKVKTYKGYFNTFKKFCNSHSLCENPANPMTVATFLTFLLDNDKSSHVVSSAAYAIKWVHVIHGYSDPTQNSIVQNLLLAAKRLRSAPTKKKDLIDSTMLLDLCVLFENDMSLCS